MKKWIVASVMLMGVALHSEAQTITLPTTKRTTTVTTTEKPKKQKKGKKNAETGIPTLPTTRKADVTITTPSEENRKTDVVPQMLPTLPTTTSKPAVAEASTEKKEIIRVAAKRRKAPRAKAIIRNPKADDNEIYESAEHIPTYPGGVAALMEFIKSNLQYPEDAIAEKAEGLIQVSFVVEKDGSTSEFEVLDEHHPSLEAEAVRVMKMMPKWNPGTQDGVKVRVEYTVPVKFSLPQEAVNDSINNLKP